MTLALHQTCAISWLDKAAQVISRQHTVAIVRFLNSGLWLTLPSLLTLGSSSVSAPVQANHVCRKPHVSTSWILLHRIQCTLILPSNAFVTSINMTRGMVRLGRMTMEGNYSYD